MKAFCCSFATFLFFISVVSLSNPVHAEAGSFHSEENKNVLADFDLQAEINGLTLSGDFAEATVNTDPRFIKSGKGSLRLLADNAKDGKPDGHPSFSMTVDPAIDLEGYRAMGFWIYAPQETVVHFFGRGDVVVTLNGSKQFVERFGPGPLRALSAGWSYYYWEFDDLQYFPQLNRITIAFGQIMESYSTVELFIDEIALVPSEPIVPLAQLSDIIADDPSWTSRYKALKELQKLSSLEALDAIIPATADKSETVRHEAVKTMGVIVGKQLLKAADIIEQAFKSDNWQTRRSVMECITDYKKELGNLPIEIFERSLFDDNYYVRNYGYSKLLEHGKSKQAIASDFTKKLLTAKSNQIKLKCIRMLDHVGPQAKAAMPQLLSILRDADESMELRYWALRAAWWIEEEQLLPEDWAVGLSLDPGEIHRRLLFRVYDRLEFAGAKAVPVLTEKLSDSNPQVRARAAAILGAIGKDSMPAKPALKKAVRDKVWYVGWEAAESLTEIDPAMQITKPLPNKTTNFKDVASSKKDNLTTISNGLVELVFEDDNQSPGPVIVRTLGGENMADGSWLYKVLAFSFAKSPNFREKAWLQRLWGCEFPGNVETKIASITPDQADFMIKFSNETAPMEWEFHYVLQKGKSGFYSYIVVRNLTGEDMPESQYTYSNTGVGRLNYLIPLTWGYYDYAVLSDGFKSLAQQYPEPDNWNHLPKFSTIMNATERLPNGQVWAKHEWELYELESDVTGYCGRNGGFWMVHPSRDYYGDSAPRWTKGGNYGNLFIPHLESKYNIKGLTVHVDADFEKTYGPMFFYINDGDNVEEMWIDAKRTAQKEKQLWPYKWLKSDRYHDRGAIKGKVSIAGGQSPIGAYVVLSNPDDKPADDKQVNVWMRNIGPYQYYAKITSDNGSFEIPAVHKGSYDFFVFKPGVIGYQRIDDINIAKGKTFDIGSVKLKPHDQGQTIWQVGIADNTPMEFKNGRNYHQWDNTERYAWDFPDDVHYVVGQSDWKTDWNYMQPVTSRGKWTPTTWTIDFDLEKVPSGKAVLMMVCAGASADLDVIVNKNKVGDLKVNLGPQHGRSAPTGEITQREFEIDSNFLKPGKNQIQLTFAKGLATNPKAAERKLKKRFAPWIVYDFVRLEVR